MQRDFPSYLKEFGASRIIQELEGYLTESRIQRIDDFVESMVHGVSLALESPCDNHNVGAVMRSCEALGAPLVHLITPEGKAKERYATTRGAYLWTQVQLHEKLQDFSAVVKKEKRILAGACPRAELSLFDLPSDQDTCLLLGNEHRGLSTAARENCDLLYQIPMHGMTESFNLSVSAAISLFDLLKRNRQSLGAAGDLDPKKKEEERARAYFSSLKQKVIIAHFSKLK